MLILQWISHPLELVVSYPSPLYISDIWRLMHPQERKYSFYSHVHQTYSRIDYFFIDNVFIQHVQSCKYNTILISDHAPLVLTMTLPQMKGTKDYGDLTHYHYQTKNSLSFYQMKW